MDIHVFMDISLQLSMLLWISMDFYGYPCIGLLWILDPGWGLLLVVGGAS